MRQVNSEWCADLMAWTGKCKVTRKSYLLLQNSTEVQFGWQEHPRKDYSLPGMEVTWTHKLFNVFRYQNKEKKKEPFCLEKKPNKTKPKKSEVISFHKHFKGKQVKNKRFEVIVAQFKHLTNLILDIGGQKISP